MITSPRRSNPPARAGRRSRRTPVRRSFLERNRSRLLWLGGGAGFLVILGIAFYQFTRPAFDCSTTWNPTPAQSGPVAPAPTGTGTTATAPSAAPASQAPETQAAAGASPAASPGPASSPAASPAPAASSATLGYVQPDMGHLHVDVGTVVKYSFCPPASGKHYNAAGAGPITPGVYGPGDTTIPQNWVHNLEHGALVLLYKCPGPACDDAGQQALTDLYNQWPNSPICNFPRGTSGNIPIFTRFDRMDSNYMALVWDVTLPMDQLDPQLVLRFFAQEGERFNPEKVCVAPTPTPGPTATPSPTATPAASSAGSPATSSAPAASTAPAAS